MESGKMVLMDLFAGQQWKCRRREQICGHSWEGEVGQTEGSIEAYPSLYVNLDSQREFAV